MDDGRQEWMPAEELAKLLLDGNLQLLQAWIQGGRIVPNEDGHLSRIRVQELRPEINSARLNKHPDRASFVRYDDI